MRPNESSTQFLGLFRRNAQFLGLIRSLPSQSPDKSGVMGELCRIVRHLGSGIIWGIHDKRALPLFEIARVLVRFDHVASVIVNANHGAMRAAAMLRIINCIGDLFVPQATEWQHIGNQIDAAFVFAGV
jgi:hypothetical protein